MDGAMLKKYILKKYYKTWDKIENFIEKDFDIEVDHND